MKSFLTKGERRRLGVMHKQSKKRRVADKIKTILLIDSGYSYAEIQKILLLDDNTIGKYFKTYKEKGVDFLLKDNYKGGESYLSKSQEEILENHLVNKTYCNSKEIIWWVEKRFGVKFSKSGMKQLLSRLNFVYKKSKRVPGGLSVESQIEHISDYQRLKNNKKQDDRIYFMDATHVLHNSQPGYGWIKRGKSKHLPSNTGRKRININGAYDVENHTFNFVTGKRINSQNVIRLLKKILKEQKLGKIFIIADNARYYSSKVLKDFTERSKRIKIIHLPPYCPNLNIIERLWLYLKKKKVYNCYYPRFNQFKNSILYFLKNLHKKSGESSFVINSFLINSSMLCGKSSFLKGNSPPMLSAYIQQRNNCDCGFLFCDENTIRLYENA